MNELIIETENIINNINEVKSKNKDNDYTIIGVVKGNAYGHGMLEIAKILKDNDINYFAVATYEEAITLRENIKDSILLLTPYVDNQLLESLIKNNITLTIDTYETFETVEEIAKKLNKKVKAHIKVDTGLSRYGFNYNEIEAIKSIFANKEMIEFEGIYTHLSTSLAASKSFSNIQFSRFTRLIKILKEDDIEFKLMHICNSSGYFKYPEMHLNCARIGSAFYGGPVGIKTNLKSTGLLKTRITAIKHLKKDDFIGYGNSYKVKKNIKVAIIPIGYHAGIGLELSDQRFKFKSKIKRILTNIVSLFNDRNISVNINNEDYKILGQIGMHDIVIDITEKNFKVNDEILIKVKPKYINSLIKRIYK